ncbi:UNVERIFIED_CONTAM: hypothetical protein FKN15_047626 [Acipenser sinensis]
MTEPILVYIKNAMTEPEVLTEVPASLKRLAKQVVRGFYGVEHALALDILIRNPCVREEDMLELLKFDRKQLRSVLNTLKGDKFIKCRMRVETAPDGKTTRHNFYFINYRLLVNVVKYKLDHMRRRIETDERDSTNRASFKCPCCFSTFTDLEANQLFDPMTGGMGVDGLRDHDEGHIMQLNENEEVMRALLIHEKRSAGMNSAAVAGGAGAGAGVSLSGANASDSASDTSESDEDSPPHPLAQHYRTNEDEDDDDDDEFEEMGNEPTVLVAGRPHSYSEVSQRPELVTQMSPEEKEAYIEMGQKMFQDMYE